MLLNQFNRFAENDIPEKQLTTILSITVVFAVIMLTLFFGFKLQYFTIDDAYITFLHSKNLIEGNGFSFNPNDHLLSTTAPLHGLILAALVWLGFSPIPKLAIALSTVSMIVLCLSTVWTLNRIGMLYAGLIAAGLIATQIGFVTFYPLETILLLALNMTAVALAIGKKWGWAGVIAGLAIVTRADAILVAATIGLYLLATRQPIRYLLYFGVACALTALPWFVIALVYYGDVFPNTLAAKSGFNWLTFILGIWPRGFSTLFLNQPLKSAFLVGLAIVGCLRLIADRSSLLMLPTWALAHTIGYSLLRIIHPFQWYYAPLIFVVLVTASIGIVTLVKLTLDFSNNLLPVVTAKWVNVSVKLMSVLGVAVLLFYSFHGTFQFVSSYPTLANAGARDQLYRDVSDWLRQNTSTDSTVAVFEVGTFGYFSKRRIIDLLGLVTYELRDLPKQGNYLDAIALMKPDYVIGIRNMPPDPELAGITGYHVVKNFPKDNVSNLFADLVIYERSPQQQ